MTLPKRKNNITVLEEKGAETKMELTQQQIVAMKRKRGERDMSVKALSRETGVSRWTLDNIFKRGHIKVTPTTFKKLNDWLIDQYTTEED